MQLGSKVLLEKYNEQTEENTFSSQGQYNTCIKYIQIYWKIYLKQ